MNRYKKGFTLIEILVSISIFLLSSSILLLILISAIRFIKKEQLFSGNIYLAQNIMETLKTAKYEDIINNSCITVEKLDDDKKIITVRTGKVILQTIRAK